MTTLVSIITKDALVMGCDSLATVTKRLVSPDDLVEFFDYDDNFKLKLDADGKPLLRDIFKILPKCQDVPYSQMSHVNKLFSLEPLLMGVMFTGITSIGGRTIKSLISEFKSSHIKKKFAGTNPTVKTIADKLLEFLSDHYKKQYSQRVYGQELELLIGGYDSDSQIPCIWRVLVHDGQLQATIEKDNFGIVFVNVSENPS